MKLLFLLLGLVQLVGGALGFVLPRPFFDAVIHIGAYNHHFVRDVASVYVALGVGMVLAAWRPAWRMPALVLATVGYGGNAVAALLEIDFSASPFPTVGTIDLLGHAAFALFLASLFAKVEGTSTRVAIAAIGSDMIRSFRREWSPPADDDQLPAEASTRSGD